MPGRPAIPLLAAAAALLGALAGVPAAHASVVGNAGSSAQRALVQRAADVPAGASVTGALAASAPVQVTVALTPSDPQALADYAQQVSVPSSPLYRHYLSVTQFAARFGADPAEVSSVRGALTQSGLSVGALASDGLALTASGTAAEIEGAFDTELERVTLPGGSSAYADVTDPTLPRTAADAVQAVAGLDTLPAAAPQGLRRSSRSHSDSTGAQPRTAAAGPSSCSDQNAANGYTAAEIGSAYGMDGQWNAGNLGTGSTVALAEFEPYRASDVSKYQTCDGTSAQVSNVPVAGGANCSPGGTYDTQCGTEDVLDIEDVAGLAPAATIHVYEGPDTGAGLLAVYSAIVQDDAPVVSTSWGLCEAAVGTSLPAAENVIFQEAAVQGEAVFAAAGDDGANDCGTTGTGAGTRAVDDPASQPYVTGVGGTTMPSDTAGAAETVWNDSILPSGGAGGGGVSRAWAMPSYQDGVAIAQSTIGCTATPGDGPTSTDCREVPDVSADADPNTGYNIVWHGAWTELGGTSAAAPTWASLVALADSSTACTSGQVRVGFANAVLYGLPASDFLDVTSGNNTDSNPNNPDGPVAGYNARTGYDMASGLGAPAGATLIPALCDTPVTVTAPTTTSTTSTTATQTTTTVQTTTAPVQTTPTQTAPAPVRTTPAPVQTTTTRVPVVRFVGHRARRTVRLGRHVRVVLRAHDRAGLRLRYSARRLPAGLRINRRTGVISGRPKRAGRRVSSISARDARGDAETIVIRWTIRRR